MGGFIALENGRAYAGSNWATNVTLRAIAAEVDDVALRSWLLDQQSTVVGMGMTYVDLRELAPQHRPVLRAAIRRAYDRARRVGFEDLNSENPDTPGWLRLFERFVEMVRRYEAGTTTDDYHPGLTQPLPATGRRVGPGWDDANDQDQ